MASSSDSVLKNPPCFRSGLMWGISVAALIGAHSFRTKKPTRRSCDHAIGAFLFVASSYTLFCTAAHRARVRQTREFMEVMNNPERKAEAEQFLRSRVQTKAPEDEQ
ncbi:hypothetical protein PRIC1_011743 [Phytophthora ramorum]|uniref:Cytochrome c oxidase assembly protein COX20, mitochondrial n=1 Tax=Phytophthora ramorum TaxID=164328 RepID=H3H018_PHYRM|nr:hypothetical protein KRP23_1664 [Phytophthora ramorum]KAH7498909.1 hypothetical protein KRP22_11210 [Phytophthora ramorum]